MAFYLTSRNPERFGHFAPSIRRVGKLAFWLLLSAIFGLLVVLFTALLSLGFTRTFERMLLTIRFRAVGYTFRILFSFAQVKHIRHVKYALMDSFVCSLGRSSKKRRRLSVSVRWHARVVEASCGSWPLTGRHSPRKSGSAR